MISFYRKRYAASPVNETALELQDFNSEEIDRYFRHRTVDPNRKDAFMSFHGNTDVRQLSSAEYYNMNESANRLKLEQDRKKEQGVQTIESNIPSNCNNCLESNLENLKHKSGTDNRSIHQILFCKKCNIRWNRDVMATKNMYTIATSIWRGDGRPDAFKRQSATSNAVDTPSPSMA
ncbi:hypothetical protein INT47_009415 [Mucor saturninus]|uniref:Uncharacterized protein n=1 Tax=Mucor saturninus TaxID=64648 RepID=A0A8H7QW12_9FUNG|nr:hypothetical protein INT47_009415 [Mucor saturninus]